MQCSVCGAEVDSGLLFCPSCGALVKSGGAKPAEPAPQPQPAQIEERAEYQQQPFAERQTGQQTQPTVEQPTANQQMQDSTPPQPSVHSVADTPPTPGKSEFEIVQPPDGDGKKVDLKGLTSISPKILIIAAVVLVAIIILLFILIGGSSKPTPAPSPSSSAAATTTNVTSSETVYLAVKDGKVAIFRNDSATPYRVTDIEVSDLDASMARELDSKPAFSSIEEAEDRVDDYKASIAQQPVSGQSQTSSQASSKGDNTVTITVVGADGSTQTGTIHRSGSSERVFPDSNTRRLSVSEVSALSDAERCIAWNEIIAASNGYAFKNSGLAAYFNSCSWYHRDPSASGSGNLSAEASANVDLLKSKTDGWWLKLATN